MKQIDKGVLVDGARPAGFSAGYKLVQNNIFTLIKESEHDNVGGITRTKKYKDFRFDVGGHRLYTKAPEAESICTSSCKLQ